MTRYWVIGIAVLVLLGLASRRGERADGGSGSHRPGGLPPSPADIDAMLRAGRKIDAIKLYRALHGVDLKAAKDAVDARARELGR